MACRLRLMRNPSGMCGPEFQKVRRLEACPHTALKKIRIGASRWRTSKSRIRYNSESIRRVVERMARRTIALWAVNANWNSDNDGWNIEANSVTNPNKWNADNQVVSRYPFLSPSSLPLGGVFCRTPLRHPPVMRPISSTALASSSYRLLAISFDSHAICRKNRNESAIPIADPKRPGLLAVSTKLALRRVSSKSRSSASILAPIPKRSSRAMFRRTGNQMR